MSYYRLLGRCAYLNTIFDIVISMTVIPIMPVMPLYVICILSHTLLGDPRCIQLGRHRQIWWWLWRRHQWRCHYHRCWGSQRRWKHTLEGNRFGHWCNPPCGWIYHGIKKWITYGHHNMSDTNRDTGMASSHSPWSWPMARFPFAQGLQLELTNVA